MSLAARVPDALALGIFVFPLHSALMPIDPFFIAQGYSEIYFLPQMANRHGLIAGTTGTGKTITLRVLACGHGRRMRVIGFT